MRGFHNKHTEETKRKISLAKKGRSPAWNKGMKGLILNRKFFDDNPGKKLETHSKYKPDRTKLKTSEKKHLNHRYKEWMLVVKKRDGWKCKIANDNCSGRLEAHHILNWIDYPELRYEEKNGITLCHAHHPRGRDKENILSPYFQSLVSNTD